MKSLYPLVPARASTDQLSDAIRTISRLRQEEDLPDFTNLNQQFISGRSTTRVPTSAINVIDTDVKGDVVYALNGSYAYVLTDVSGVLKWARIALDTAW